MLELFHMCVWVRCQITRDVHFSFHMRFIVFCYLHTDRKYRLTLAELQAPLNPLPTTQNMQVSQRESHKYEVPGENGYEFVDRAVLPAPQPYEIANINGSQNNNQSEVKPYNKMENNVEDISYINMNKPSQDTKEDGTHSDYVIPNPCRHVLVSR